MKIQELLEKYKSEDYLAKKSDYVQETVSLLKNGKFLDTVDFIELLKSAGNSGKNDGFFEAVIFSLIIQIKNYERYLNEDIK